jgi:Asp-tRNA(Asn)/Glu-tRNA(Gln) amidotransferase A subunit family amidase
MGDDLSRIDALGQADLVRTRKASPLELVDAAIARIERLNPTLNAVIHTFFERAREEARRDAMPAGPFHGVPFLLKDLFGHSAGDPMHFGARFLKTIDFRAPHDSYLAGKFRAAGLVFLGRTNVPELGILPATESQAYGPARNPWNTGHSTGGSSGGSAAAVASGMVPVAHGNDGGGSIRIPASECGLVGLKPSRGRTSFGPDVGEGVGGLAVEGVVSRTVRDTAAMLDVAQGYMPGDPYTAPPPARSYASEVGASPGRLRIGIMTASPASATPVHAECAKAAEQAGRLLVELGHTVDIAHPDALDDFEVGRHFSVMYAAQIVGTIAFFERFVGRPLGPDDFDPLNWAMAELGRAVTVGQYLETEDWIGGFTRRLAAWWADGWDLLLTPTLPEPPPPLGYFTPDPAEPTIAGLRAGSFACWTSPFNMSGQPGISLPLHWTPDGLPVGVQLVAAYGREDLLLRVAATLEQAAPWKDRRPPVHA